jgi:hypothetical protein
MDYAMPRPGLVGGLRLSEHPVPTATNPLRRRPARSRRRSAAATRHRGNRSEAS